ncbi:4Fe-4S dicluster domain-containing protein [Candidatus Fermentibacteria bacterium]|nr:4Fe-4S dicluster domain-containing protein [Candidatus Fermentibacteria bacterium]
MLPDEETAEFPVEAVISQGYYVIPSTCIGCGLCVAECPTGAISLSDGKVVIDPETCILCGLCTSSCPTDAIVTLSDSDHFVLFGVDNESGATVLEEL